MNVGMNVYILEGREDVRVFVHGIRIIGEGYKMLCLKTAKMEKSRSGKQNQCLTCG